MSILHILSAPATEDRLYAALAAVLGEGDVLVVCDLGVSSAGLARVGDWLREIAGLQAVIPAIELAAAGLGQHALPAGLMVIDDQQWLRLVAAHERIQHWS